MFYGRERELQLLADRYDSDQYEFLPIYGRRRVGKTTLLREFMKGRNGVFYTARRGNLRINIDGLASKLFGANVSADLDTVLDEIGRRSHDERFVLIIDEYPRIVKKNPEFGDALQEFIDRVKGDSKLFLILCGSSLSVMEHDVLGYRSPLYGRRTGSLKLMPFDVRMSMKFLEGFVRDDAMRIYGMVGGIPLYLEMFDSTLSLKENLSRLFFREDSFFRNEHTMMMIEEFDNPATYYTVIEAVASGRANLGEIATYCGLDTPTTTKHLKSLISIGIISKHRPVDNPKGKMTRYTVSDPFLRFQFSRILPIVDDADPQNPDEYVDKVLELFDTDMGAVFEEVCAWHLRSIHGGAIGRWWGSGRDSRAIEEIDVISTKNLDGIRNGWFAECKYRAVPTGQDVLDLLIQRASFVKGYPRKHYVLYSKAGFTESLVPRDDLELYTLDDVLGTDVDGS